MPETLLILAPRGRDAVVIETLLIRNGLKAAICPDVASVQGRLADDLGGLLLTEEALVGPDIDGLLAWLDGQPPWSDIPVVVLAAKQIGRRPAGAANLLERLGNVVILERPVHAETLLSAVKSALRVRRRQYQARSYLLERKQNEQLLRDVNETLEMRVLERASELDRARETLAVALDSAGMGSWDLDLLTGEARRTLQHDAIFGYQDLLPRWSREIFLQHVVEDDQATAAKAFDRAAGTGMLDLECRIKRVDGEVRWIAAKGRVGYDQGAPVRMAGVIIDITERRFTEEALRQSQKMQAIGQLTGGLAHDFNNLLTGITGSLELLGTRLAQGRLADLSRYIEAAQGAATRAASLTHRLLAFSRRQTLDPKPTDINRLGAGMEELIRRTVGPMITLQTIWADDLWPVLCDPNQLENALLNFCINSRDAMPDGGRLTLATTNIRLDDHGATEFDLAPGAYVMLSVSDTGSGMPADVMARAFDPFFTTKPMGTGTGLGLSMAYGFARQSGGQVRIDSKIGRGTTIQLYLPWHNEAETVESKDPVSAVPTAEKGETVLIVDDEATIRALVAEVLDDLGYTTIEASESVGALGILQSSRRIDLLVTDVGLPGLNGRQLADAARRIRPGLKVMFITGYAETAAIGPGQLEAGMHVLTKPFAMDALARKIRYIVTEPMKPS